MGISAAFSRSEGYLVPKTPKIVFLRFAEKYKVSSSSYFKMGKIGQKFADLVKNEIWVFLEKTALFLAFRGISAENALESAKCYFKLE